MTLAFQLAVFLGAFLLFLVQPLIAKQILPWFGGGSTVWSACLLFFQLALVAGYAYAHHMTRFSPAARIRVHLLLLILAALLLPIAPSAAWKPPDGEQLVPRVLALLAVSVGAPYVLLAATAPLLQDWYARLHPGRSPYWLYVLSNAGSLTALLVYPVAIEPRLAAGTQSRLWSVGFLVFAVVSGWCAWRVLVAARRPVPPALDQEAPAHVPAPPPSYTDQLLWMAWPACSTGLLLATTSTLTQDIAAVPMLWIAPLAIYLLTFMLTFAGLYTRALWAAVYLAALGAYWFYFQTSSVPGVKVQASVLLVVLASACMVCHGELVALKPPPVRLTEFYLALAVGGSFGGVFVAVAAPIVFDFYLELPLLLLLVAALVGRAAFSGASRRAFPRAAWLASAVAVAVFIVATVAVVQSSEGRNALARARSYYGVLTVYDDPPTAERAVRRLYHGRILHGSQFIAPALRSQPTSYYSENSGVGLAIRRHPRRAASQPMKIGAVGLGAGTIAAHGFPEDRIRFFELDPLVIDFARRYFTYLQDARARIEIVTGDARLSLEREMAAAQHHHTYDVMAVDAFSGDAVPVHLLTREAFALYDLALRPDGILALHISNRYLDLKPVVQGAVTERGWKLLQVVASDDTMSRATSSNWLLATRNEEFVNLVAGTALPGPERPREIVWTDDFSSLLSILR